MLTVNDWPALAVTPHTATFCVSDAVLVTEKDPPQENAPVGASVGRDEGTGEGAVGAAVGIADGLPESTVGPAVGKDEGDGVGRAVVGRSVGMLLGDAVGRGVVGKAGVSCDVGEGVSHTAVSEASLLRPG